MKFDIRSEDWPLIAAAVGLGDWLVNFKGATKAQVETIRSLQAALRRLPQASPGLNAEYGFRVWTGENELQWLAREWCVYMNGKVNVIEIFSNFVPYPEVDIWEMMERELSFDLRAGEQNKNSTFYYDEWIKEVSNPAAFRTEGCQFAIEANAW